MRAILCILAMLCATALANTITFEKPLMYILNSEGVEVGTRSTEWPYAFEKLQELPAGEYQVVRPPVSVVVTGPDTAPEPEPEPEPDPNEPSGEYTQLGPLTGYSRSQGYPMPAYDSPEDAWAMIEAECGPVGTWGHYIEVAYRAEPYDDDDFRLKGLDGCIHVKGILGPNGERPVIDNYINATRGYNGEAISGGLLVENVEAAAVGVPNNKKFLVLRNVHLHDWASHAFITSGGNKHMYVEVADSHFEGGRNNHAMYIDNVAFANIQRNVCESPGMGHCIRSIAQKGIIKDNLICSVNCDGTRRLKDNGKEYIGMAPLEVYVNGEHLVEGNEVRYYRATSNAGPMASVFRNREGINVLDRLRNGDQYDYLVWGTDAFNDPATWSGPMIDTVVRDHKTVCQGEPCYAWDVKSTYPYLHDAPKSELQAWWKGNCFPDWKTLIANADPSWHGTLNLMTDDWKAYFLDSCGRGLPNKIPFPVPDGWQQKARISFEGLSGENLAGMIRPREYDGWCAGEIAGGECVNQEHYLQAEIVEGGKAEPEPEPSEPVGDWLAAIEPYIPDTPRTVKMIPGTSMDAVLMPHDGTRACDYLECSANKSPLVIWTSMGWDAENGCAWFVAPGGHGDLGTNSVHSYCFGRGWQRNYDYAQPTDFECGPLEDGPVGIHDYDSLVYVPSRKMTMKLNGGGYQPGATSPQCTIGEDSVWGWSDSWVKLTDGVSYRFARTAYDPLRDKVYFVQQLGWSGMYEMDPHTMEARYIRYEWAGKGGAMAMEGRYLYWTAPNGGTYRVHVSETGAFGDTEHLLTADEWNNGNWGFGLSEGVLVGWAGEQTFGHYNTETGELELFKAAGDALPKTPGESRVYGKFVNVKPGVFVGISDTYGWIVYRAY